MVLRRRIQFNVIHRHQPRRELRERDDGRERKREGERGREREREGERGREREYDEVRRNSVSYGARSQLLVVGYVVQMSSVHTWKRHYPEYP